MINSTKSEKIIGITGASGALGKELTKLFRQKGYKVKDLLIVKLIMK